MGTVRFLLDHDFCRHVSGPSGTCNGRGRYVAALFFGFLLTGPWFSSSCLLGIFLTFWPFGTGNGKGTVRCYCGSVWLDHDLCRHVCLGLVGLATRWDCTLRILGLFSAYFFFGFGTLFLFKGFCDFYFWKEKRQGFLTQTWGLGYMGLLASTLVHQVQSLWVCYLKSLIFLGLPYTFMGLGLWEVFLVLGLQVLFIVVSCEGFSCIIYV